MLFCKNNLIGYICFIGLLWHSLSATSATAASAKGEALNSGIDGQQDTGDVHRVMTRRAPAQLLEFYRAQNDEVFPASFRVVGPPTVFGEIIDSEYNVITRPDGPFIDVYLTEPQFETFAEQFAPLIEEGEMTLEVTQTRTEFRANQMQRNEFGRLEYHTYETMLDEIRQIENDHPDIAKVLELGPSCESDLKLWALKISDNVDEEEDEPVVSLEAGIHGTEIVGPELVFYVINYLLDNLSDSTVKKYIEESELWFLPIVNPSGHRDNTYENSNGVNLNRNQWPIDWKAPLSRAQRAEQEVETLVNSFYKKYDHNLVSFDWHAPGGMYMWPYSYWSQDAVDVNAIAELGKRMGDSAGYRSGSINEIYGAVPGNSCDYIYGAHGSFCYGVELGQTVGPPVSEMENIVKGNFDAAMMAIDRVHQSLVTGHITNDGEPVVATVTVDGVDSDNAIRVPIKSDETYGRYFRLLTPGTYKITYTYDDQDHVEDSVEIVSDKKTIVDVHFGADADTDSDSDSDSDADGDTDGDADSDADGDSDGDADGDSDEDEDDDDNNDNDNDSDVDDDNNNRNEGCGCSAIGRSLNPSSISKLLM